jgi:leucyl-tRNA synthetase
MEYKPRAIENKWKKYWEKNKVYKVENPKPGEAAKPKFYVLDMFPYPSGAGLHVGHPLGYIASDIFARFKRMNGFNVLHPMGFDAFGLPAEQYAIQTGVHPAVSTDKNIKRYREQLDNLGFSFDWDREVKTCDPKYYKWTQWIFIQLFSHYYDNDAQKAMPIENLINSFETNGNKNINAANSHDGFFTAEEWKSMTAKQKDDVLMNYRLAYRKVSYVNWCEALGTVLANDEVKDGVSERGGYPVVQKPMLQWSLRITAYAERLLNDLNHVEWSDALKAMQRNWIGRSEGAQLFFEIENSEAKIEVFTTRPDTIFGATYMVLAPEHPLVSELTTPEKQESIDAYLKYVNARSDRERMAEVKEVTGAFLGAYAINPFTKTRIPIWIGEYVLMDYGTGAIMAVPSDDERDHAFATKFELPIIDVIDKTDYPGAGKQDKLGKMINSDFLTGMEVPDAIEATLKRIEELQIGQRRVNYRLRDANYSRQRYWGEPFPIKYDADGIAYALADDQLPLELPELEDYKPTAGGKSPLARNENWVNAEEGFTYETDTMPGFAGSSWYFLRYMDAANENEPVGKDAVNYWQDVDLYVGGTEHAVGHLMYSRFWHKFLHDKGIVPTVEPFKKLINQGMIQGRSLMMRVFSVETDSSVREIHVPIEFADQNDRLYLNKFEELKKEINKFEGIDPVFENVKPGPSTNRNNVSKYIDDDGREFIQLWPAIEKMSKSKFNAVNPDDVVEKYGSDCFRMYEMFLGPIEHAKPWDTKGIDGVSKFLRKFWSLFFDADGNFKVDDSEPSKEELKILHTAIKKVTEDIERFSFNTCVSAFMVAVNDLKKINSNNRNILEELVRLIAPFAPHIAEELWEKLGEMSQTLTVQKSQFPQAKEAFLKEDSIKYPIAINGKTRAFANFPADASKDDIEKAAIEIEDVQKWTEGKTVRKIIVVPNRMVNIVVG